MLIAFMVNDPDPCRQWLYLIENDRLLSPAHSVFSNFLVTRRPAAMCFCLARRRSYIPPEFRYIPLRTKNSYFTDCNVTISCNSFMIKFPQSLLRILICNPNWRLGCRDKRAFTPSVPTSTQSCTVSHCIHNYVPALVLAECACGTLLRPDTRGKSNSFLLRR